jgi:hypothetical protein
MSVSMLIHGLADGRREAAAPAKCCFSATSMEILLPFDPLPPFCSWKGSHIARMIKREHAAFRTGQRGAIPH